MSFKSRVKRDCSRWLRGCCKGAYDDCMAQRVYEITGSAEKVLTICWSKALALY